MRADRLMLALVLAVSPAASADPGDEPHAAAPVAPVAPAPGDPVTAIRALARRQLTDETAAVERAQGQVTDKLAAADATRLARLRAAYRALALRGDPPTADAAMDVARVRAAARILVDRDAHERGLLTEEAGQLRAAHDRIAREATTIDQLAPPDPLTRPVAGKIVRRFGLVTHERAKATLSRRGVDFEVDDHAQVLAPAAGTVRYVGPIRGLDHGVILDHGAYLTVIAKLGELALPIGAPIAAGDRLGRAARHRVYLEVRLKLGPGGLPIDPEPLLAKPQLAKPR